MMALAVEDLAIEIAGAPVVDGVTFSVESGQVLALVGESGCGKSLTAFALLRLLPDLAHHVRGRIRLAGRDLTALTEREMRAVRGRDVSIIFQEPTASLDPLSTVGAQIIEAVRLHQRLGKAEARSLGRQMLVEVGIADPDRRLDQYPFELSGGMCQRIMIAIALIGRPAVLIADEPTTALDVTIQAQILELMKRLVAERQTAIVLITHDMGVVADIADRVAVMYAGRIVELAPARRLFDDPAHPYTALLLKSVPRLDDVPKASLSTIEGSVPPPHRFPAGCRFVDRCPLASAVCAAETPPLTAREPGHFAACWHMDRVGEIARAAA